MNANGQYRIAFFIGTPLEEFFFAEYKVVILSV
jgi:hypothetical protein